MRRTTAIAALAGLMLAAGCGDHRHERAGSRLLAERRPAVVWRPAADLLFDPTPDQAITASDFAFRSPWPCTAGAYSPGEVVYYREYYYDHQGHAWNDLDHIHRRFHSYRYGTQYRR